MVSVLLFITRPSSTLTSRSAWKHEISVSDSVRSNQTSCALFTETKVIRDCLEMSNATLQEDPWLREGIVDDAALTSVISADIETRCADDEKWEVGGRGVKATVLKGDEVEEGKKYCVTPECRALSLDYHPHPWRKREREVERASSAAPHKSAHFPSLIMLKFHNMKTSDSLKPRGDASHQINSFRFVPALIFPPSLCKHHFFFLLLVFCGRVVNLPSSLRRRADIHLSVAKCDKKQHSADVVAGLSRVECRHLWSPGGLRELFHGTWLMSVSACITTLQLENVSVHWEDVWSHAALKPKIWTDTWTGILLCYQFSWIKTQQIHNWV